MFHFLRRVVVTLLPNAITDRPTEEILSPEDSIPVVTNMPSSLILSGALKIALTPFSLSSLAKTEADFSQPAKITVRCL